MSNKGGICLGRSGLEKVGWAHSHSTGELIEGVAPYRVMCWIFTYGQMELSLL